MGLWLGWFQNCPSKKKNQEKKIAFKLLLQHKEKTKYLKRKKKFILLPKKKKWKNCELWKNPPLLPPIIIFKNGQKTIHKKKKSKSNNCWKTQHTFCHAGKETIMVVFKCMILSPLSKTKKNYRSTWNDIALSKGLKIAPFTLLKKHYNNSSSTPKLFAMLNEIR